MKTILLVGAGHMGGALLRGWIKNAGPGFRFVVLDPNAAKAQSAIASETSESIEVSHCIAKEEIPRDLEVAAIVVATKPALVQDAIGSLTRFFQPTTALISIAAGVSVASLQEVSPAGTAVVRVMPNIGAMVGHSVSAGFASSNTSQEQRGLVTRLFEAVGQLTWLENEGQIHMATALSGSGPAYYFAVCEAMIAVSEQAGLPPLIAKALAIGTVTAAGELLDATPEPEHLREMVTSPNGTTAAGLEALLCSNTLNDLVRRALVAASQRSIELS
jgi:pyrroline-5-carboxylate reductase